ALAIAALLGAGCAQRQASEEQILGQAKKQIAKPSLARDLFEAPTTTSQWQEAFQQHGTDADLHEAYAYKELLSGRPEGNVEGALTRVRELRTGDPWAWFLTAKRAWLASTRTHSTQSTSMQEDADEVLRALARARELAPDNAFYAYQEGAFRTAIGDVGAALGAFEDGNKAPAYQHPFGVPLPRTLTSLEKDLLPALGDHLYVYFRTNPRMFLGEVNTALKSLAATKAADAGAMATILRAGARQLDMEPFDLPSFQGAVGLNKALWQQYGQGDKSAAAKPVLDALSAFDKPFQEFSDANDSLIRRLRGSDREGLVAYGAAALKINMDQAKALAPLRKTLTAAIQRSLPAETAPAK
ncbi:MAG TPA: hypothetical protein VEI97_04955, partial [bacterium]|nr:hypothetical protein [bacterium]